MYTVTFINSLTGAYEVSRYFETVRPARKWARWLISKNFVASVKLYRGQAGAELIEEWAR